MMSRLLAVGAVASATLLCAGSWSAAATSQPVAETSSAASLVGTGSHFSSAVAVASRKGGSAFGSASDCVFYSRGDSVRLSAGGVTGRGWWDNVDCRTSKARVTVQIQYLNSWGYWRNVGDSGSASVSSGADNKVAARISCRSMRDRQFRSVIDVDLAGIIDDSYKLRTAAQTLSCSW